MSRRPELEGEALVQLVEASRMQNGLRLHAYADSVWLRFELWQYQCGRDGWHLVWQHKWKTDGGRLESAAGVAAGLAWVARALEQDGWPGVGFE